jgi:hypothetical protein
MRCSLDKLLEGLRFIRGEYEQTLLLERLPTAMRYRIFRGASSDNVRASG